MEREQAWESCKKIIVRLLSTTLKASEIARVQEMDMFSKTLRQDTTQYKAKQPQGIDKPSLIGGKVKLNILTATNDHFLKAKSLVNLTMEDVVVAEIKRRNITIGKKALKALNLGEKQRKIREDEYKQRVVNELNLKQTEVSAVKLVSKEMKDVIEKGVQEAILDKANGKDELEGSL